MAINIKPANRGKLHAKLGVPQGEKIPAAKLAKAKKSSSPALRKEATFAQNAKSFSHAGTKDSGKVKVAAMTPFGNKPKGQTKTPVKTDRGDFQIKG